MAKLLRIEYAGAFYHVTARGNERKRIYFSKTDYGKFREYIEEILASGHPTMEGVSVERLKSGPVMAQPSDRPQQFGTPTGRIEFYVESIKQFGQELPVYIEPVESVRSEKARSYPLSLLSTHPSNRVHSTLAIVPGLLKKVPNPTRVIFPSFFFSAFYKISHAFHRIFLLFLSFVIKQP